MVVLVGKDGGRQPVDLRHLRIGTIAEWFVIYFEEGCDKKTFSLEVRCPAIPSLQR